MNKDILEQAIVFLNDNLAQDTWKTGSRLPTTKILANQAGVSYGSMLRAINILKKEKKVSVQKQAGIFAGPKIPLNIAILKPVTRQKKRHETIHGLLYKDIFTGDFASARFLPSIKELCTYYHADFTVIKKALELLVADGILVLEKRRYRIKRRVGKTSANIVYMFAHKLFMTNSVWHFEHDWWSSFINTLETACNERNIRLIKHFYDCSDAISINKKNVLGSIIYHTNNPVRQQPYQDTLDLLKNLRNLNTPTVLIAPDFEPAEIPNPLLTHYKANGPALFYLKKKINIDAGRKVGQFLLANGHKKVCFFAPAHYATFTERYSGLCESFNAVGLLGNVTCLVPDKYAFEHQNMSNNNPVPFLLHAELLKSELGEGPLFAKGAERTGVLPYLLDMAKKLENDLPADPTHNDILEISAATASHDMLEAMIAIYKIRLPALFKDPLKNAIQQTNNAMHLQQLCFPLFEQALQIPGVTAWVCAEDHLTNAAAMEFCKYKNISIPEQLGLIGFQNHFESCINNISSYHFDFARTALKALSLVTHPRHSAKLFCKKDSGEFAFEGMVIDRGSA